MYIIGVEIRLIESGMYVFEESKSFPDHNDKLKYMLRTCNDPAASTDPAYAMCNYILHKYEFHILETRIKQLVPSFFGVLCCVPANVGIKIGDLKEILDIIRPAYKKLAEYSI